MRAIISLLILLLPFAVSAQFGVGGGTGLMYGRSKTITLCSAEAGTGICDDGSSVDYRAHVNDFTLLTFTTVGSTGSYRCQIYQLPTVVGTSDADLSDNGGTVATRFDLSNVTQETVTLVAGFGTVWLDCTSNTGSVTATVRAQR